MEPSTLYNDPLRKPKPSAIWILITLVAGAIGALSAVAAAGKGTYEVNPFMVELSARPAAFGKTELAIAPDDPDLSKLTPPGRAEAGTHAAPIVARVAIKGLAPGARLTTSDSLVFTRPQDASSFLGQDGKKAVRAFCIKLALLALGGGAAAGALIGFRRWRRIIGAAASGLLTFAVIGFMVQQTYDAGEFAKTRYVFDGGVPAPTTELPGL